MPPDLRVQGAKCPHCLIVCQRTPDGTPADGLRSHLCVVHGEACTPANPCAMHAHAKVTESK